MLEAARLPASYRCQMVKWVVPLLVQFCHFVMNESMCACVSVCTCGYMGIYVGMFAGVVLCVFVYAWVYMCVFTCMCLSAWLTECAICVCVLVSASLCVYAFAHMCFCAYVCVILSLHLCVWLFLSLFDCPLQTFHSLFWFVFDPQVSSS